MCGVAWQHVTKDYTVGFRSVHAKSFVLIAPAATCSCYTPKNMEVEFTTPCLVFVFHGPTCHGIHLRMISETCCRIPADLAAPSLR